MWIAAVRLSRRRTWQTSCATTAANWSAVRYDRSPSGSRITGRRRPTTPGSSTVGAVRISMPAGTGVVAANGVLARTAARISRHCRTRRSTIAANPQSPHRKSNGAIHCGCAAAVTIGVGSSHIAANGALKSRTPGDATTRPDRCRRLLPFDESAGCGQRRKRHEELDRRGEPETVAKPRAIVAQRERQEQR